MASYSEEKLRLPLIRKVFRQADKYVCGLCKTDYQSYGEANSCMNQCWFDIHHFYPVVKRKRAKDSWVFRCLFCCRDYAAELTAYECARRCVGDRNKAQVKEQLINEQPLPPPSRPVSRLMMLARVKPSLPAPQLIKAEKKKTMETKKEPEIGEVMLPVKEKVPFRGLHKSSYAKQWARKGEKYQCLYCREIWFTKSEAEKCFGGHFKEDGYETIMSIDPND